MRSRFICERRVFSWKLAIFYTARNACNCEFTAPNVIQLACSPHLPITSVDFQRRIMPANRTKLATLVIWALAWAAAMIASAILLKGNPIKDWVQSALFIGAMIFWVWQAQHAAKQ
jgi:hypothetical protein